MHPYVLIPLVSAAGAAGLSSAILAREPGLRANQLMALLLGCAGLWSLCEFFFHVTADPDTAVHFVRWSSLGSLMLSPISAHLMLTVLPEMRGRFRRTLKLSYALTLVFVLVNVTTPWYAAELTENLLGLVG